MENDQRDIYRRLITTRPEQNRTTVRLLPTGHQSRAKQQTRKLSVIGGTSVTCPQLSAYIKHVTSRQTDKHASLSSRTFPSAPERVLDAPGLVDDFYLNVLDWGKRNILAVALGPSVYLWNGKTGSVTELFSLPDTSYITSLRWIHDGSSIAVGSSLGHVQIWDAEAGKKLRTIVASEGGHRLASLAWNKHLLSTGSRDGCVGTNDVRLPRPLILNHESHHTGNEVCGLEWSPDGSQLASGGNDNLVQVWDVGQASPRYSFCEHRSAVKALAWCPWKQGLLATGGGSQDRQIRTWNTITGSAVSITHAEAQVSSLVWSRTSHELISTHGSPANAIRVWKVSSSSTSACHLTRTTGLESAHASRILHTSLSPDGQTLVTAGADESIKFWRAFEQPEDTADLPSGPGKKKKPGMGGDGGKDYVLMPRFSRSGAVSRAMAAGNRLVQS